MNTVIDTNFIFVIPGTTIMTTLKILKAGQKLRLNPDNPLFHVNF